MARMVACVEYLLLRDGDLELMDRAVFIASVPCFDDTRRIHACDCERVAKTKKRSVAAAAAVPGFDRAHYSHHDELQISRAQELPLVHCRRNFASRLHAWIRLLLSR